MEVWEWGVGWVADHPNTPAGPRAVLNSAQALSATGQQREGDRTPGEQGPAAKKGGGPRQVQRAG